MFSVSGTAISQATKRGKKIKWLIAEDATLTLSWAWSGAMKIKKKQNLMAAEEMVNTGFNPSSGSAGTSLPMDSAYKTDVICCSGIISG